MFKIANRKIVNCAVINIIKSAIQIPLPPPHKISQVKYSRAVRASCI